MKIKDLEIIIGSDPELFVKKGDKFISGHDLIPGTKQRPYPVKGGAVQVDGTALEFNTMPAKTRRAFHASTNAVLRALKQMIPDGTALVAEPTAEYGAEYMATLPDKAKELGCDPDYNAYTGEENPKPNVNVDFRTGAGHIHVGWTEGADICDPVHMANCRALVQAMDVFLGIPSLLLDGNDKRRELYGKAGAFRPKPYGVEYRVLSNFWVMNRKYRAWVFDNTLHAVERMLDRNEPLKKRGYDYQYIINNNSKSRALRAIEAQSIPLPDGLSVNKLSYRLEQERNENKKGLLDAVFGGL